MFGTTSKMVGEEGLTSLWKGVNAAWLREASYTSLRLGLYEPIKIVIGEDTFVQMFVAGSVAGAIGSVAGNPWDLIKYVFSLRPCYVCACVRACTCQVSSFVLALACFVADCFTLHRMPGHK
jgi:hypothetical protein